LLQGVEVFAIEVEEAHAGENPDAGPEPAALEVGEEGEEIAEAEEEEDDRQEVSGGTEDEEEGVGGAGTDDADPVLDVLISWNSVDGEVVAIVGPQRDKNDYGKGKENDAENVISAVSFSLIRSCFSSHARRIIESG
jgi:hypothetical protein